MPSPSPPIGASPAGALRAIGERLRARRKQLRLSATSVAEGAGMSRATLHRIERGEPSVAMGAYLGVIDALGLDLDLRDPREDKLRARRAAAALPDAIRLTDCPQLEKVAWQLRGRQELTPKEALDLYERNWRHVQPDAMDPAERELLELLLEAFGRERLLV